LRTKKPSPSEAPAAATISSSAPITEAAKAKKIEAPKAESSDKKSTVVAKESPEPFLADVTKHGREVTKSQDSKTRTRAQIAEDEMLKDLEKFK
jgi:hypothetical protein